MNIRKVSEDKERIAVKYWGIVRLRGQNSNLSGCRLLGVLYFQNF
jgi:hypothetical protein